MENQPQSDSLTPISVGQRDEFCHVLTWGGTYSSSGGAEPLPAGASVSVTFAHSDEPSAAAPATADTYVGPCSGCGASL